MNSLQANRVIDILCMQYALRCLSEVHEPAIFSNFDYACELRDLIKQRDRICQNYLPHGIVLKKRPMLHIPGSSSKNLPRNDVTFATCRYALKANEPSSSNYITLLPVINHFHSTVPTCRIMSLLIKVGYFKRLYDRTVGKTEVCFKILYFLHSKNAPNIVYASAQL